MALIEINEHADLSKVLHKLDLLTLQIHRLEKRMTEQADALKAAIAKVKADVAAEIKQLADAIAAANNGDKEAIVEAMNDLNQLAADLEGDDPAPTPVP